MMRVQIDVDGGRPEGVLFSVEVISADRGEKDSPKRLLEDEAVITMLMSLGEGAYYVEKMFTDAGKKAGYDSKEWQDGRARRKMLCDALQAAMRTCVADFVLGGAKLAGTRPGRN